MEPDRGQLWARATRSTAARAVTALAGSILMVVAVVSTLSGNRAAAQADLDASLGAMADAHAVALEEYFERAESVNLLLAHDSALRQFAPGARPTGGALTSASAEANAAMAYLERLYPGRISEACLIDASGTEIARVVRGEIAPPEDLSTEEAAAPFFTPTLRLPVDRVHQAAPYLSPDTDQWVVSNSTPLVDASGVTWGMVHFEVALDSFRPVGLSPDTSAALIDTATGRVLLQSDRTTDAGPLGRPGSPAMQTMLTDGDPVGTVDGQRVAVARVGAQPHNENAWAVAVTSTATAASWTASVGVTPVAMGLAAVLLLAFAGLALRSRHRGLTWASLTDELTGLPNRRQLMERLGRVLAAGRRRGVSSAVLLIDLDRFKEVNDTLGHHHGDELLRAVALRLASVFRDGDTVARLGGDEFAVLLPDVADEAAAVELARRCSEALEDDFVIEGLDLHVEASVGVAIAPLHGSDGHALMRAADVAMYESKTGQRGVVVYDSVLDVNTPTRLALLGDLRRALRTDQIVLHYQPKVDLTTGRVTGAEALVRWYHPTRGLVSPVDFVPAAETTTLIMPLTMCTLELAAAQARRWMDGGHRLQVAVNLSPRCLLENGLVDQVGFLLVRHGLPAELLRLEITETTIMVDPARALSVLLRLRELGVSLSIDDFGTGYSSMTYLKQLPVDELKIDRSFVTEMTSDSDDGVLVRSSIELGHNLGMTVVAEGVEDEVTMAALAALGCDSVQGFHLARPMEAAALTGWLDAQRTSADRPVARSIAPA